MMSPVVVKMLTDLCRVDKQRQIEHRRAVEKANEEGLGSLRGQACG